VVNKLLFWTSLSVIMMRLMKRKVLVLTDTFVGITWWPRGWLPRFGAAIYAWTIGWLILLCAEKIVLFHPQPLPLLRKLRIAKKTRVIPTGIDPAPYGSARTAGTGVVITYVGRLESVKGVEDFLAAAVPLKRMFVNVTVQVAGWFTPGHPLGGQYRREVNFLGLRHDIPALLRETDIFVLPSFSEGLSNALMEAMASGCACVASDVGGNRFLLQNSVSGFLFPAGDREALRAHLRRLIEDPAKRHTLAEGAQKRIREVFSWDVVGKQYDELFSQCSDHAS